MSTVRPSTSENASLSVEANTSSLPEFRHGLLLLCIQLFFCLALASTIANIVMGIVDHMLWTSLTGTAVTGLSYLYLRSRPEKIDGPASLLILFSLTIVTYGWFHFGGILGSGPALLFPMSGLSLLLTTRRRQLLALLGIGLISCALLAVHLFLPGAISPYYPSQEAMLQDMAFSQLLGILIVGVLFIRISSHHLRGWEELSRQQQQNLLLLQASAERAEHELLERLDLTRRMGDSLAHDINNMLTVVMGSADLIESEDESENREAILDSAMTATRLLQRYRQHHAEASERLEIEPILRSLTRSVSCLAPNVTVTLDCHPEHPQLMASRVELEQVIMNLCLNAVQAMSGLGQLHLEVSQHDEGHNELVVPDSGAGIPAESIPFIFEPFFTTKKDSGGTGIGLSNVRRIVEQWGGRIEVQSTLGHGTRFQLLLPAA